MTTTQWQPHRYGVYADGDGFRISYSPKPPVGEGEETALFTTTEPKRPMLILYGDWRKDYEALIPQGYDACKAFYDAKKADYRSRWSEDEDIEDMTVGEVLGIVKLSIDHLLDRAAPEDFEDLGGGSYRLGKFRLDPIK